MSPGCPPGPTSVDIPSGPSHRYRLRPAGSRPSEASLTQTASVGNGDRAAGPARELEASARAPDSAMGLQRQVHPAGVRSGIPGTRRELRKASVPMRGLAATLIATLIATAAASAAPGNLDSTFG